MNRQTNKAPPKSSLVSHSGKSATRTKKPAVKTQPERIPAEALERAASLFRACGDPARLRLLEVLSAGEHNVTDLAESSDEGLSTISQRLRLLRAEGLVSRRREGKHIYYGLQDGHVLALIKSALEHAMHPHQPHDNEGDEHD